MKFRLSIIFQINYLMILLFQILVLLYWGINSQNLNLPWGVRLSFGQYYTDSNNFTQLYVTFNLDQKQQSPNLFTNNHLYSCKQKQLIILNNQTVGLRFITYIYRCPIYGLEFQDKDYLILPYQIRLTNSSNNYSMKIINKKIQNQYSAIALGDWGLLDETVNLKYHDIFPCLEKKIQQLNIAFFIFLGDMAYELTDNNCEKYKQFLKKIEKFTSFIPFMLSPGNHDTKHSYQLFTNSFYMPNWDSTLNYFYTFEIGQTTFISYNPEIYVYDNYPRLNTVNVLKQVQSFFLSKTLNNRNLVAFSHYSMFCSDPFDKQCKPDYNKVRLRNFLQIFDNALLDLYIGAHIHVYQRNYPITIDGQIGKFINNTINESYGIYKNPEQIIYISEGAGGNTYFVLQKEYQLKQFGAKIIANTGFGVVSFKQVESIIFQHYLGKDCSIGDYLYIQKDTGILNVFRNQKYWLISLLALPIIIIIVILFFIYGCRKIHRLKKFIANTQKEIQMQEEKYSSQI